MSSEMPSTPEIPGGSKEREERMWGMLCHLSAFAGLVVPYAGFVVGPLIIWLIKKDEFPFVNDQGKESLNFQISMLIYAAVAYVLTFTVILAVITIPALIFLAIYDIIQIVLASVKANEGERYRYPLTIRFLQ